MEGFVNKEPDRKQRYLRTFSRTDTSRGSIAYFTDWIVLTYRPVTHTVLGCNWKTKQHV